MIPRVRTIKSKQLLKDALREMVKWNIGSVVVVKGGKPVGIVTERDISRNVAKGARTLKNQVKSVMSSPLIAVSPNEGIQSAMTIMLKNRVRRLPVIEKEKLVGILTERDILRWVLKLSHEPLIPKEIKQILEKPASSKPNSSQPSTER